MPLAFTGEPQYTSAPELQIYDDENYEIRLLVAFSEVLKEGALVAKACNHPKCFVLPFRLELIRLAA